MNKEKKINGGSGIIYIRKEGIKQEKPEEVGCFSTLFMYILVLMSHESFSTNVHTLGAYKGLYRSLNDLILDSYLWYILCTAMYALISRHE